MPEETIVEVPVHNPLWGRVLVIVVLAIAVVTAATVIMFPGKMPIDVGLSSSSSYAVPASTSTR